MFHSCCSPLSSSPKSEKVKVICLIPENGENHLRISTNVRCAIELQNVSSRCEAHCQKKTLITLTHMITAETYFFLSVEAINTKVLRTQKCLSSALIKTNL